MPEGEKAFFRALMGTIDGMRDGGSPQVAEAARMWRVSLAAFIKTRLKNRRRRSHLARPGPAAERIAPSARTPVLPQGVVWS